MTQHYEDETIMTPDEHAIALQQHSQQYPLARINAALETTRRAFSNAWDAAETSVQQSDPAPVQEALKAVWSEVETVYQTGVEYHNGFKGGVALAMSLTDMIRRMVDQLTDAELEPADRMPVIQAFAENLETRMHDEALEMMFENAADTMTKAPTWDISEADAKVFIIFLLTGQLEVSTARVLGQMLPQLEARLQAIGAK